MTVVIQHMSPKEIADLIPVDGLSPQDRKRAEATRAYLIDLVANPVDPSPLLKARVSGDPVQIEQAAVHYGIQLGLRARGFWLETIAGRKRLAGLVTSREEKGYLDAQDRAREWTLFAKSRKRGLEGVELAAHVRKVLLRLQKKTGEPRHVPTKKTLQNRISASKSRL